MPKPSALTPENEKFCRLAAEFCDRHYISNRKLSGMIYAADPRIQFQKTTAYRFRHAQTDNDHLEQWRPVVAKAFVTFLEDRGFLPTEIEAELSEIFDPKEYMKMIANRCTLLPEAVRYFGLKFDPFDVDRLPDQDELFTNPQIDAVVGRIKDAVLYQRFVAVIGGVGTGKTLLKQRVALELAEETDKVRILYPEFFDMEELSVPNIANAILRELGQTVPRDKGQRVSKMRETLTQLQQEGIVVAVIIDECHRLRDKVISSFKNFWEMTNGRNARLLGMLLFGQPQFTQTRLRDVKFKEIRQRVQIIPMPNMNGASRDYLAHRLDLAGGKLDKLFEPKALDRICLNADTPLALGNLANGALMAAFEDQEKRVTASMTFFKSLSTGNEVLATRER